MNLDEVLWTRKRCYVALVIDVRLAVVSRHITNRFPTGINSTTEEYQLQQTGERH